MSGQAPAGALTPPGDEAAATAARAAAAAARLAVASETAARLADLAAAEEALGGGHSPLRLEAVPVGAPGVTAPATVDTPAVAAVAVGLGFYVEAASLREAADLAAARARVLGKE
jgi:hypothetical protein